MVKAQFDQLIRELGYRAPREDEDLKRWIRNLTPGVNPDEMSDEELQQMSELRMAEETRSEETRRVNAEVDRRLEAIPQVHRDVTLHSFAFMPKTLSKLMSGMSALVLGLNGCGKSGLAWAIYRECVMHLEWPVVVVDALDLLYNLKDVVYKRGLSPWQAVKERYGRGVTRLFIDELDKIKGTEDDYQLLFTLVNYRYQWRLQTVAFANGTLEQIIDLAGQSTVARLTSDGAEALKMPENNFRSR